MSETLTGMVFFLLSAFMVGVTIGLHEWVWATWNGLLAVGWATYMVAALRKAMEEKP